MKKKQFSYLYIQMHNNLEKPFKIKSIWCAICVYFRRILDSNNFTKSWFWYIILRFFSYTSSAEMAYNLYTYNLIQSTIYDFFSFYCCCWFCSGAMWSLVYVYFLFHILFGEFNYEKSIQQKKACGHCACTMDA